MTAAYRGAMQSVSGLRLTDPYRDMGQIASLIELVFGDRLDRSGRRMVRDMRRMGELGWLGWIVSLIWLPSAARLTGFVWEQDGSVVGNLGLSAVEGAPGRWVMANIAVHPDFRRRGIGRGLVRAGLEWVQRKGGQTVLLQVDSENQTAQQLYAAEGFRSLTVRVVWRRSPGRRSTTGFLPSQLRRREAREWGDHFQLAQQVYPEGTVWPYPNTPSLFRPSLLGGLLGLDRQKHWVWEENRDLIGAISLQHGAQSGTYRVLLIVEPERRGEIEPALLACAFEALPIDAAYLTLDYPAGCCEEVFGEFGFRKERVLTWMQIQLPDNGS